MSTLEASNLDSLPLVLSPTPTVDVTKSRLKRTLLGPLYTRPNRPKGPSKLVWTKKNPHGVLHGVLHDNKWIMFHSLPIIALGPSKRGGSNAKLGVVTIK